MSRRKKVRHNQERRLANRRGNDGPCGLRFRPVETRNRHSRILPVSDVKSFPTFRCAGRNAQSP